MLLNMLKSIAEVTEDVATVALAPVAVAVEVTKIVTRPIADVAQEAVKAVTPGGGTGT